MENYKCRSVGIIGSGIQGVCTGLQLIKKGIPVTIFDRQDLLKSKPASYGNAGHFSPYAVLQFNRPDIYTMCQKCFLVLRTFGIKMELYLKCLIGFCSLKIVIKDQCYISKKASNFKSIK